jgi:nitrate reductase cytochrome c-type subunit
LFFLYAHRILTFRKPHAMTSPFRHHLLTVLAIGAGVLSVPAGAAEPLMKPGLWETASKPSGAGGAQMQAMMAQVQQHMRNMPAADRARAESMMAKNGVTMDNGTMTAKICITPEMARRQQLPMTQRGNCNYQVSPPVGKTLNFTLSCSNPNIVSEGSATFSDSTHYMATSRTTGGMGAPADGAPATSMSLESTGRWLSADCGSIQPVGAAASSGK